MQSRKTLAAFVLVLSALFICLLLPSDAAAEWNPQGESGEAIYEVRPLEKTIHVKLIYNLRNLDSGTISNSGYYSQWPVYIHNDAANIRITTNTYSGIRQQDFFKVITVNFSTRLFYGQTASIIIEYDLLVDSPNNIELLAFADTYRANLQIIIPRGYFNDAWLSQEGYVKEETQSNVIYRYAISADGRDFSVLAELTREAPFLKLSSSVRLAYKNASVIVNYREGELGKAKELQALGAKFLPVLEKTFGVPFPQKYPVLITQSTSRELGRWAGLNAGEKGIFIPFEGDYLNEVLLHELAHYWAKMPPYSEDWMREGQADLYAYLALREMGYQDESSRMIISSEHLYNSAKNQFDLPLAELDIPQTITSQNTQYLGLAYSKSFLFMLNLYQDSGLEVLQKANREIFASGRTVNWFEYLDILERVSGRDMKKLFAGWVLPAKFTQNYDRWLLVQGAFREMDSLITKSRGSYGIEIVEGENQAVSSLIAQGSFSDAQTRLEAVKRLYGQWEAASKAYLDAEKVIVASTDGTGIALVEKELKSARDHLIIGRYELASARADSALKLYGQWQNAEKIYREAEVSISQSRSSAGIEVVEEELKAARELLLAGQYNRVSARADSALKLYEKWQSAEKAYGEAYDVISPHEGSTGMASVSKELKAAQDSLLAGQYDMVSMSSASAMKLYEQWQKAGKSYGDAYNLISPYEGTQGITAVSKELRAAQDLLAAGQYDMVSSKAGSALDLFEQWKTADRTYREAYNTISANSGAPGMAAVNKQLKTADDSLAAGQYKLVSSQVQTALSLYGRWQTVNKDYRDMEDTISGFKGSPGISLVEAEVKILRDLLEKGELEKAAGSVPGARGILSDWKSAYETLLEARRLAAAAREEGRTWGLKKAEDLTTEGETLLKAGNLPESRIRLEQAINAANRAVTPFTAISKVGIALALLTGLLASVLLYWRRNRSQKGQTTG